MPFTTMSMAAASIAGRRRLAVGGRRPFAGRVQAGGEVRLLPAGAGNADRAGAQLWRVAADPAARAAARSKILQDGDQTLQVAYASLKGASAAPMPHVADASIRCASSPSEELESGLGRQEAGQGGAGHGGQSRQRGADGQAGAEEGAALLMPLRCRAGLPIAVAGRWRRKTRWPESAWRRGSGYTAVEFDVMLSGDGTPVLIHDETLERTTNGAGRVCDTPDALLFRARCRSRRAHSAFCRSRRPVPRTRSAGQRRDQTGDRP
jgi:hypothetical protein